MPRSTEVALPVQFIVDKIPHDVFVVPQCHHVPFNDLFSSPCPIAVIETLARVYRAPDVQSTRHGDVILVKHVAAPRSQTLKSGPIYPLKRLGRPRVMVPACSVGPAIPVPRNKMRPCRGAASLGRMDVRDRIEKLLLPLRRYKPPHAALRLCDTPEPCLAPHLLELLCPANSECPNRKPDANRQNHTAKAHFRRSLHCSAP
jgi:hypothetical protein